MKLTKDNLKIKIEYRVTNCVIYSKNTIVVFKRIKDEFVIFSKKENKLDVENPVFFKDLDELISFISNIEFKLDKKYAINKVNELKKKWILLFLIMILKTTMWKEFLIVIFGMRKNTKKEILI